MPTAPLRFCGEPGCGARVPSGRCPVHQQQATTVRNHQVGHRWYRTARWRRLRAEVLTTQPFCDDCHVRVVDDVHHRIAHRGDETLFWLRSNAVGLCRSCHAGRTARGE